MTNMRLQVQAEGDACNLYRTELLLVEDNARLLHPDSGGAELHALHSPEI
jgi:hypothetical protein